MTRVLDAVNRAVREDLGSGFGTRLAEDEGLFAAMGPPPSWRYRVFVMWPRAMWRRLRTTVSDR